MIALVAAAAGAAMLALAVVRARRSGAAAPAPLLAVRRGLPLGVARRALRASQGLGPVPDGELDVVREFARAEAGAPGPSVLGFAGAALMLAGAGVLADGGLGPVVLWLVSAVMVAGLPFQLARRRRRAAAVLAALGPKESS